ncbi:MAG: hypothetical protein JWN72_1122 [Thermoleophilia bacterium]|nr:hypothetical protein [Thermoleophilia bacterium]
MNPVHVLVGNDPRAEAMWSAAFGSTIDLYRFATNVDAFGRLSSAEAPIDLVVLTPAQDGPFNLTSEQLLARVFEGPLGSSRALANLHVIVVGEQVARRHPRIASVRTLEAAIRLVKFGEVDTRMNRSAAPVAATPRMPEARPSNLSGIATERVVPTGSSRILDGADSFSGGVISKIWDAVDRASHAHDVQPDIERANDTRAPITGGGAPTAPAPSGGQREQAARAAGTKALAQAPAQLFTKATSAGFMVTSQGAAATAPAAGAGARPAVPGVQVGGMVPVQGGGMAAQVGAPGESIEVATGQLLPARQFQLAEAGYRGQTTRGGVPQASSHHAMGGQPVPPALASQVQSMIYGGAGNDPMLTWSGNNHGAIVATGVPVPQPSQRAAQPAPHAQPVAPMQSMASVRGVAPVRATPAAVPMQPPVGVYGGGPVQAAAPQRAPLAAPHFTQAPQLAHDPFLARAEAGGGDVSFG